MRIHFLSPLALVLAILQWADAEQPAPRRDLSGVWALQTTNEVAPDDKQSPGGEIPPITAWAKARYDAEKPGYGKRAAPGGNDPILQCDPMGFPRIIYFPTPFEF